MTIASVIHGNANLRALRQNYPEIERLGNAPTSKANPITSAPQVDKPITRESVIALVPDAEAWAIYSAGSKLIDDLFAAIDSNNRVWLAKLLGIAGASGKLSEATIGKLQAELTAKVADPTWTATIPGPSIFEAAGLGYVTAGQIQGVDNELQLGGNW